MSAVLAAALPAAVAGISSFLGGERANALARGEAAKNRAFQERMRNTEWQAAVADMEAAGINPAVAYSRGGASSPGGSMAQQSDTVTPAVGSALAANAQRKQLQLLDYQIMKAQEEAHAAHSDMRMKRYDEEFANARRGFYFDIHGRPTGPLAQLLKSEHAARSASSAWDVSSAEIARFSVPEQKAIADLFGRVGEGGKAYQLVLPLILKMLSGR